MSERAVEVEYSGAVAWIWMNRPEVHNAFEENLIEQLTNWFVDLGNNEEVRVLVLSGRGRSFSAGADVTWMRRQGTASLAENTADARNLAHLFKTIAESPKPTIARVHGAAIGGGLGLVAACDIAIASNAALFATAEVRLGLIPATIAPYVVRAIGERQARYLFQTGERIDAATAMRIGLLHAISSPEELNDRVRVTVNDLLLGGPHAQRAAKSLITAIANQPITTELISDTANRIARCRTEPEALEGLTAFLEKRPPAWISK
jgi:methylglutaconyl-CoA hydratase